MNRRETWPGLGEDAQIPRLDGELLWDDAARDDVSRDAGRYLRRVPRAVLRPGSVGDVQAMVRFCRAHRVPVSVRGLANTTHGQGLGGGLLIDGRSLASIHSVGPDHAVVDAGATWLELTRAAHPHGLTPPALTGYLELTLGGTLSLGGIPPAFQTGSHLDTVRELDVVTGTGELVRCSPTANRDVFEAVLGGLGQFGIVTRATVDLVPARQHVRGHALSYADAGSFFGDLRTLLRRGEVSEVYGEWWRPGERGDVHHLEAFTFYDDPPDGDLLRGLAAPASDAEISENGFLEHVCRIDDAVEGLRAAMGWHEFVKPWFTVWLPESGAERFVTETVAGLCPDDVGTGGFVLLYAHRRSRLTRPSLRLPAADGGDWVYLFTLMTAGPADVGPGYAAAMLRRNRALYERARELGGVRYPIESTEFGPADWRDHYGDRWPHLEQLKRQLDPAGILAPGAGVFA